MKRDVTVATNISIPLTLYWEIHNVEQWNEYTQKYSDYENFKIVSNLDFGKYSVNNYQYNVRIGRLVGDNWDTETIADDGIVISGLNLSGSKVNFIYRLNSGIDNIEFADCSISSKDRDCVGFVGTSAGDLNRVRFTNCSIIQNTSGRNYAGCIGYQNAGNLTDITLQNVTVKRNTTGLSLNYVGGLTGGSQDGTIYQNISATGLYVDGTNYVGGMTGFCKGARYNDVELQDKSLINASGSYCGGIVGYINNVSVMNGITVSGSKVFAEGERPERIVANGKVTINDIKDKDVVICASGSYVGGIFGEISGDQFTARNLTAKGIHVLGGADRRGGLGGTAASITLFSCQSVNNYIGDYDNANPGTNHNYVGGLAGTTRGGNDSGSTEWDCAAVNCVIDVTNCSNVGGYVGYKSEQVASTRNRAENCLVKVAVTDNAHTYTRVGGLFGAAGHQLMRSSVINTIVDAPDCDYVGGIVGFTTSDVLSTFYWGQNPINSAASGLTYYVKGRNYVGGVVGELKSGSVVSSYSNANVYATGQGAGGLVGYYRTEYLNNGDTIVYSNASVRMNYFAGRVHADQGKAGGLIGVNGLSGPNALSGGVTSEDKNVGIRIKGVSHNNSSEISFTSRNVMLAESVTAGSGTAYALCGTNPYYLEKANDGTAYRTSTKYVYATGLWEATKVATGISNPDTGLWLTPVTSNTPGVERVYELLGNDGKYQYKEWTDNTSNIGNPGYVFSNSNGSSELTRAYAADHSTNVFTFSSADLDNPKLWFNLGFTRTGGGYSGRWPSGITDSSTKTAYISALNSSGVKNLLETGGTQVAPYYYLKTSLGYYCLVLLKDNRYKVNIFATTDTSGWSYTTSGKSILPYTDDYVSIQTNTDSDYMIHMQLHHNINMIIPAYVPVRNNALRTFAFRQEGDYYADIYPVAADKVNVEFSADLAGISEETDGFTYAYFILSSGGKEIARQLITQRVYTFEYAYMEDLDLQVGYADVGTLKSYLENTDSASIDSMMRDLGTEDAQDLVFADDYRDTCLWPDEELSVQMPAMTLRRKVMTYGSDYYYITSGTLHSGDGNVLTGDYIHMLKGKVLSSDGSILDVASGTLAGTVKETCLCENAQPLFTGKLNGAYYETYEKFCEILSGTLVTRQSQILTAGGMVGIVDSLLDNRKESAVMYKLTGRDYFTVLGSDGILTDMYQGKNINAPEAFQNKGILYMSNNMDSTGPYILVQYTNGGVAGYNYATGEMLFKEEVEREVNVSLFSFMKTYFEGDKSILACVSDTYDANYGLLSRTGTPSDLRSLLVNTAEEDIIADRTDAGIGTEKGDGVGNEDMIIQEVSEEKDGTRDENLASSGAFDGSSDTDGSIHNTNETIIGLPQNSADTNTSGANLDETDEITGSLDGNGTGVGDGMGDGVLSEGTASMDGSDEAQTDIPTESDEETSESKEGSAHVSGSSEKIGESDANGHKEVAPIVSTAGTKVITGEDGTLRLIETADGMLVRTLSDHMTTGDDPISTEQESTSKTKDDSKLIMIYNATSGTYELVSSTEYFTNQTYLSENHLYGITDLSTYSQCVVVKKEKTKVNGLILYILVASAVVGGVGLVIRIRYKKKRH